MKYLFLTIFFLASFAVIACGQIVFPSPNQVEMQKGYLTLRKRFPYTLKIPQLFI